MSRRQNSATLRSHKLRYTKTAFFGMFRLKGGIVRYVFGIVVTSIPALE